MLLSMDGTDLIFTQLTLSSLLITSVYIYIFLKIHDISQDIKARMDLYKNSKNMRIFRKKRGFDYQLIGLYKSNISLLKGK